MLLMSDRAATRTLPKHRIDFSFIRYAQCWEDADILLRALDVTPGDVCVSIASAGDNTLALLTRSPQRVVALDLNPAQISCLELRVAAYRALDHPGLLELIGSSPSSKREGLYRSCRPLLSADAIDFWDDHPEEIQGGIGAAGKLERYFAIWHRRILPLTHSHRLIDEVLRPRSLADRHRFYDEHWDSLPWQLMVRVFCSRFMLGHKARDPQMFAHTTGNVGQLMSDRIRHAFTDLDPSQNPYLQWILTGRHRSALPLALRPEHFDTIRNNLDRLEWQASSLEDWMGRNASLRVDRFNLSDIFEYLAPDRYEQMLARLAAAGAPGGRLVYWNMMASRSRPESLAGSLRLLTELASRLHAEDKAFFYSALRIEELT